MAQTITNMGQSLYQAPAKKSPQQICEEKGGTWDAKAGICILARNIIDTTPAAAKAMLAPKTEAPKPARPVTPEVYRDEETGRLSGVALPSGETFLGIKPKEVKEFISNFQETSALPAGTQPGGTAQQAADRTARLQQLMQMGQQGLLSQQELAAIQEAPIDWSQALTAGSIGNLPSVLKSVGVGAAAGAGIGAVTGLGIGAVPGAIIGGIGGFISAMWGGTQANIKKQQAGEIAKTKDVLAAARTNMRALSLIVSKDPAKAEEAIELYYQQLAQVHRAYRQLQLETQGDLNKFMEDGTQDLSDFELFLQPNGYADIQLIRLQQAAFKGTPASDEELIQFYQEEFSNE